MCVGGRGGFGRGQGSGLGVDVSGLEPPDRRIHLRVSDWCAWASAPGLLRRHRLHRLHCQPRRSAASRTGSTGL